MDKNTLDSLVEQAKELLNKEVIIKTAIKSTITEKTYIFTQILNSVGVSEEGCEKQYSIDGELLSEDKKSKSYPLQIIVDSINNNSPILNGGRYIKKRKL